MAMIKVDRDVEFEELRKYHGKKRNYIIDDFRVQAARIGVTKDWWHTKPMDICLLWRTMANNWRGMRLGDFETCLRFVFGWKGTQCAEAKRWITHEGARYLGNGAGK